MKCRPDWPAIAKLPSLVLHGNAVKRALESYLTRVEWGERTMRPSFDAAIVLTHCPVCRKTLAAIFRRITELEMKQGHNGFEPRDIRAARKRFDGFWQWWEGRR